MKAALKGNWSQGSGWEFIISNKIPNEKLVTATAGIAHMDQKVVLTKTHRGWEIPGGHMEEGETIYESLEREMLEETGIRITSAEMFGYIQVKNSTERINKSTKKPYPSLAYIPHFFVGFNEAPVKCTGTECLDSSAFDIASKEVLESDKKEIIQLAHSLWEQGF